MTVTSELPPINNSLPPLDTQEDASESEEYDSDEEYSEETVYEYKLDPEASFFATFIDGSSFRYLIEYLRLNSSEGTFVFKEDSIIYAEQNEEETVLNYVKIKTYELTDYEFNSFNDQIISRISLSELRNKTRTIGKKEQMDIYKRAEEPTNLYIQVRSQEKSSGDNPMFYCMPMKSDELTILNLPEYSRGKKHPNCTIYQSDFSKVCKALVANKCSYVEVLGYETGIIIKGFNSKGGIATIKEYGKRKSDQDESKSSAAKSILNINSQSKIRSKKTPPKLAIRDADEIDRFKIYINQIKSLAKLNGFSPSGTVKFYIEKDKPMKIDCNIGTFGKLSIFIRNAE